MNEQKKKIIIGEIEYWRRTHLLPGKYCDFLLNLYTEGESAGRHTESKKSQEQVAVASGTSSLPAFSLPTLRVNWVLSALPFIVLLYLAFHFTDFTLTMQMTLIGFFTLLFYLMAFFTRRQPLSSHLFLGIASLLLAIGGMHILKLLGYGPAIIVLFLGGCCLVWFMSGIVSKKRYVSFCGLLGLLGIYGWTTQMELATWFSWWRLEAFWLPIAIVLIAFGLLWKRRQEQTSAMLFFAGMAALFGSEIVAMLMDSVDKNALLYFIYIKIFIALFLLLSLKNFWWSWVSKQPLSS
ncbi:hypothetical protein [Aneurinibacillus uraniidurans]|uniref:hypothetical protein n=1 Tax=Aneurinibacillus uraniidurans TaxID=2966586 RepID=UPI00234BE9B8|nr:hypothetical protein [Aneurinibacillus sp. B1]WCN38791.1 hypothetical protein PO771_05130 [Aneurinibacillus sp. B1]